MFLKQGLSKNNNPVFVMNDSIKVALDGVWLCFDAAANSCSYN
jgi:hypothetical protein